MSNQDIVLQFKNSREENMRKEFCEKDEPIHFHITKGNPSENDTKVWVLAERNLV